MTPDVIVCWPRNCDYPLWRQFIRNNRDRFAKVIVVFTEHPGDDLSGWVREHFPDVTFLDSPSIPDGGDWRDVAVNAALDVSDAEWVWFTEQDFLIHQPDRFWPYLDNALMEGIFGFYEMDSHRLHPACLFVVRSLIDRTGRYFGPVPVDHFFRFGMELAGWAALDLGPGRGRVWEHLQGTTQNHSLLAEGIDAGVFNRRRFREYLRESLRVGVPLEPGWAEAAKHELRGARGE